MATDSMHDRQSGRRYDASWPADPDAVIRPGFDDILERAEIRFVSAAEWRCPPGWSVPRRSVPTCNYSYHLAGTAVISTAEETFTAQRGDLVLLPPGLLHSVRQRRDDRVHGLSGHFTARSAGGLDVLRLLGVPRLVHCRPGRDDAIVALVTELARSAALRPCGWQAACTARVRLLLDHLLRHHGSAFRPVPGPPHVSSRLAGMLAAVSARRDDPTLSIADLARAAGVSTVRLRSLCRQHLGCAPLTWLHRQRIAEACRLLATTADPVIAVAERCGFADPVWFHRLFRRITGTTPMGWRSGGP